MIKRKTSTCIVCGNTRQIYAKKMCGFCYERQRKKTPIKRPSKPIRKRSKNSIDQHRRYKRVRDKFLEENPICMYPGCISREVTLHHARGRIGSFLTDKRWFKSLCWKHHLHIETHPAEALKLRLSFSRLTKD